MDATPRPDYPVQIKQLRLRLGLTQTLLAERLGVSFPTVNRWENGKSAPSQLAWTKLRELAGETDEDRDEASDPPHEPPPLDFTSRPEAVLALVEGERLSFGHLANPAFATETSNIDPLPHQRIAVYDFMLRQPRLRFLLADDAGAGKTIMTGLYTREQLSRRLIRRVLIVPPAGLVGNWEREMQVLFNLTFNVVAGPDAKNANPFVGNRSDRVIVSVDTLAGERMFARLREERVEPYDLIVFDEAHKLSVDRGNDLRVRKTDRYRLAEALAGVRGLDQAWRLPWSSHHLLLLTATPHQGKEYPYYGLWRLLDPDVLSTPEAFDHFPAEKRQQHFIRRTKEEMVFLNGKPLYPKRISDTLGYDLTQGPVSEQTLYDETTEYMRIVYNRAKMLNRSAARLAMSVLQRRLASSTYALLRSFDRRIDKLTDLIRQVQDGKLTEEQLVVLQRRLAEEDDVFDSKTADEEGGPIDGREEGEVSEEKLLAGVIAASLTDLVVERDQVYALRDLARQVYDKGEESKFDKLREVLTESEFAGEKFIVFTEHRDTLDYLVQRLGGMGYTGQIAQIHGGMYYTERQQQVERFRLPHTEGGARFMICTDAAAEGINLQFCWIMINFDVPWNPARLEQRMGRIHRYGQKHDPVRIVNLVAPKTREGLVIETLLNKLEIIRDSLGSEKVFDSIGRLFEGVSLKAYMERAVVENAGDVAHELDGRLTKEQVEALAAKEKMLYGDGGDVKRQLPRLRDDLAQEAYRRLLPGYVRQYLQAAAPLVDIEIDGDMDACFSLRATKKGAADPLLHALEAYSARERDCLTVVRPETKETAVWVHPGEPVFEQFRAIVGDRLGAQALRGAVFVDPTAAKPYLFHVALVHVIREADAAGEEDAETRRRGDAETGRLEEDAETRGHEEDAETRGRGDAEREEELSASPRSPLSASPRPPLSASPRPPLSASPRPPLSASPHPPLPASPRPPLPASPRPPLPASPFATEEVLECRLVGVKQCEGAEITLCPVEQLLLLKGGHGLPPAAQRLAAVAEKHRDQAAAFLTERIARGLALERREGLLATLPEREQFIQRGFNFQETELAAARVKQSEKARSGNAGAMKALREIKDQQRSLAERRAAALATVRREPELIVAGDVSFIAHALIVPSSSAADLERHDAEVERVAMEVACAFEEAEGAIVKDVHTPELARAAGLTDYPGFDLLAIYPDGDPRGRRAIEVKGRAGTGDVEVSSNEWARAANLRNGYWLYVVYDCATPAPRCHRVQDPFGNLLAKAKGSVLISAAQVNSVSAAEFSL